MLKLLSATLLRYLSNGLTKARDSDGDFTVVVYKVTNKAGVVFTRIDIFTAEKKR